MNPTNNFVNNTRQCLKSGYNEGFQAATQTFDKFIILLAATYILEIIIYQVIKYSSLERSKYETVIDSFIGTVRFAVTFYLLFGVYGKVVI